MKRILLPLAALLLLASQSAGNAARRQSVDPDSISSIAGKAAARSINEGLQSVRFDSILPREDESTRYTHLTEEDFQLVAAELDVEVAAMNNRNRKMGHNAALELTERMDQLFQEKAKEQGGQ